MSPLCDLFVLCGEPSGDAYAATIVRHVLAERPGTTVAALGGDHLREAGAEIEHPIDGLAVMGLWPVLARLPEFLRLGKRLEHVIRARRPRVVLTIDYPGFNLRLVRRLADLRQHGTRFVHVVAPQVWAWKPRRAKRIAASVDRLLCFFPFEPALFNRFADRLPCRAEFVGHPLLDLVDADLAEPRRSQTLADLDTACGLKPRHDLLLLAPGSRAKEVAPLLPIYAKAAELVQHRLGDLAGRPVQVAVSRVPDLPLDLYRSATHFPLIEGRYRAACLRARGALIASGTATLEAALCGLPHAIAYRCDRLTAAVARQVLLTDHVGLPNIVLGRRAFPEVLQSQVTPERLAAHLLNLWAGERREQMLADLKAVRHALGAGGAVARMGAVLLAELDQGRRKMTERMGI